MHAHPTSPSATPPTATPLTAKPVSAEALSAVPRSVFRTGRRAVRRAVTALAGVAVAGCLIAGAPVASAGTATPDIVGGTRAPSTPWAVQLEFSQGDGGVYGCSGEQLNSRWVLTARHCVSGTTAMHVYQSNSTSRLGTAVTADHWYSAPTGDIGLVHLARSAAVSRYATVSLTYRRRSSGTATIMGYGLRAGGARPSGLYQATVDLVGSSTDAYRGHAQHVRGRTGASNHGDSGGPLVVSGAVVGVCSTGDTADPGSDIHAGSNYAVLAQSASWLRRTAGL